MLKTSADRTATSQYDKLLVQAIIDGKQLREIQSIMDTGIRINARVYVPDLNCKLHLLLIAAFYGQRKIMELFINSGAYRSDKYGAIYYACQCKDDQKRQAVLKYISQYAPTGDAYRTEKFAGKKVTIPTEKDKKELDDYHRKWSERLSRLAQEQSEKGRWQAAIDFYRSAISARKEIIFPTEDDKARLSMDYYNELMLKVYDGKKRKLAVFARNVFSNDNNAEDVDIEEFLRILVEVMSEPRYDLKLMLQMLELIYQNYNKVWFPANFLKQALLSDSTNVKKLEAIINEAKAIVKKQGNLPKGSSQGDTFEKDVVREMQQHEGTMTFLAEENRLLCDENTELRSKVSEQQETIKALQAKLFALNPLEIASGTSLASHHLKSSLALDSPLVTSKPDGDNKRRKLEGSEVFDVSDLLKKTFDGPDAQSTSKPRFGS